MLFSLPVAFAIGFSAQVAGRENKIPDQAREILEKATQFELFSIGQSPSAKNAKKAPEDFHEWPVIGKTIVKDPDARKRLVAALEKSVEESNGYGMKCFEPRHGIRATYNGTTADFLICFQCRQVVTYVVGGNEGRFYITDSSALVF